MLGGSSTSGALRSPGSSQPSRTCPLLLEHVGDIFLLLFLCARLMASTGTLRVHLLGLQQPRGRGAARGKLDLPSLVGLGRAGLMPAFFWGMLK